jgi:malonyl-CoA O-methyltransferase
MRSWLRRRYDQLVRPLRTLASVDAYALWSSSYPPYAHNRLMEVEQAAMERLMPPLVDRVVLDLACGTGRYGLLAQKAGARRIVGVDNSRPMLRAGQLTAAEASMTDLPFGAQSFDAVICGLALGHLPPDKMRRAMQEIGRVLRPGGVALLSDFHPFVYLRGGRRTFSAPDGTRYTVEHYPHLLSDYFNAVQLAGMSIVALDEPRARVGKSEIPAVLVMRCHISP